MSLANFAGVPVFSSAKFGEVILGVPCVALALRFVRGLSSVAIHPNSYSGKV
jgi:hypothetical protein